MKSGATDFVSGGERVHSHRSTVGWRTQRNAEDKHLLCGNRECGQVRSVQLGDCLEARWFVLVAVVLYL